MADIELVVKLPEETYEYWKIHKAEAELLVVTNAVINGTPLKEHDKELIRSIVYVDLLDKIRAEIEECEQYRGMTGNPVIDKHNVGLDKYYDLGLEKAIKIIDKYRKGDK